MRVLHIYSGNLYGGIETLLLTMARRRDVCPGIEPEVALCFDGRLAGELGAAGVTVHHLPAPRASRPHTVRRARRALASLLESGGFDRAICHAAWSQAMFGGVVRRANIPLVFWAHDAARGTHWTERVARRIAPDLVICNSGYTAASLGRLYDDVPTVVVTSPIELDAPTLTPTERTKVRREFETAPDATLIIQASRLEAWKGHTVVIEALARVRARTVAPWIWWVVGGAQRPREAAYASTLVAAVHDHGLADCVRWLGERPDIPRLLAAADVHCQANLKPEPFGIVYVEALAAGLPVVASRAGGAMEIVDESCGVLVSPGDVEELAAALERLIVDGPMRSRLGACGPARARALSEPAVQLRRLEAALAPLVPAGASV